MAELSLIQEKSRRIQLLKRISIAVFSLLILTGYSLTFLHDVRDISGHVRNLVKRAYKDEPKKEVVKTPAGFLPNFTAEYMILYFYFADMKDWQYEDVTLASQCSANHLHHVINLLERWSGPMSIAVFAPDKDSAFVTDAISSMRKCWPQIRDKVTFHLVYPIGHTSDVSSSAGGLEFTDCNELVDIISKFGGDDGGNYKGDIPYPHNVLRNVAIKASATKYTFLIDIDVLPNEFIRERFNKMAASKGYYEEDFNENVVFVVPCFEMQKGYVRSKNKKHLLEDFGKGLIRPFHNESCWWCHSPEEHPHWLDIPLRKSDQSKIVFNATWNKNWEPFYIGSKDVPLFDERFKQYGFDRQQQICELFTAGYTFSVLDDAFLVHDGWKFPHAAARLEETYRNWVLFNYHYQQTLMKMYDDPKSCNPVETWFPRWPKQKEGVRNRKIPFKKNFFKDEGYIPPSKRFANKKPLF